MLGSCTKTKKNATFCRAASLTPVSRQGHRARAQIRVVHSLASASTVDKSTSCSSRSVVLNCPPTVPSQCSGAIFCPI